MTGPYSMPVSTSSAMKVTHLDSRADCAKMAFISPFRKQKWKQCGDFYGGPNGSFFLFSPRGTGKSTRLLYLGKDRLKIDGIAVTPCETFLRQLVAGQSSTDE